jgi:hypothetical protein
MVALTTITSVALLLFGAVNAAPTDISQEFEAAGSAVEARAYTAGGDTCAVKEQIAFNNWDKAHKHCNDMGIGSFFHAECWYDSPRGCCPENRKSASCTKFWPNY